MSNDDMAGGARSLMGPLSGALMEPFTKRVERQALLNELKRALENCGIDTIEQKNELSFVVTGVADTRTMLGYNDKYVRFNFSADGLLQGVEIDDV